MLYEFYEIVHQSVKHRHIPGGHTSQTCLPLDEELVKVPRGQGRKRDIEALEDVSLNPEDKRKDTKTFAQRPLVSSTATTPSSEF